MLWERGYLTTTDGDPLTSGSDLWDKELLFGELVEYDTGVFGIQARGQGVEFLLRLICMRLVGAIPEEGMLESAQTLKDIFEFYAYEPQSALPYPSIEKVTPKINRELQSFESR